MAVFIDDKVIDDLFVIYTDMQETVEIGYTFSKDLGEKAMPRKLSML
ncbi:hypothetical protein ACNNMY_03630 [Aerococcus urinaeequi]